LLCKKAESSIFLSDDKAQVCEIAAFCHKLETHDFIKIIGLIFETLFEIS